MMRRSWELVLLVVIGSLSWSVTMVKSGLPTRWGLGFWGANGHDGIWHLALIESIKHGFPIANPLFAGTNLTNYHWGFDFVVSVLSMVTRLSASVVYFQVLPPILALAVGILSYLTVKKWTGSTAAAFWATFFTYFGGSFGWIVTLIRDGQVGGESLFWAQQAVSTLVNPPYALSLVLLIGGLYLILRDPLPRLPGLVLQILIFGLLFIIKSYAGIIGLSGIFIVGVWQLINEKKMVGMIRWGCATVLTILIILMVAPNLGGLLVFEPLWFPRTMVEAGDRLSLPRVALALTTYFSYRMYPRIIVVEFLITFVFLLGNLGTRVVALLYFLRLRGRSYRPSGFLLALLTMTALAVVFPLLFIQRGTAWNTIQFFYYAQVFLGWLAGIAIADLGARGVGKRLMVFIVVLLTLPTTISTLWYQYIPGRPPAALPFEERAALEFLKNKPLGTVLAYPYESPFPGEVLEPPVSLGKYASTAYVSAYSGKPSYLADTENLSILGISSDDRLKSSEEFFAGDNAFSALKFLKDNHITYIYLVDGQQLPVNVSSLGVTEIYKNSMVNIFEVQRI